MVHRGGACSFNYIISCLFAAIVRLQHCMLYLWERWAVYFIMYTLHASNTEIIGQICATAEMFVIRCEDHLVELLAIKQLQINERTEHSAKCKLTENQNHSFSHASDLIKQLKYNKLHA